MKILVFCSDLIPLGGFPTSGGGLRSWQLVESCRALGHEVVVSVPLFTYLSKRFAEHICEEIQQNAWTTENQDVLVRRHQPDAVLFCSSWMVDRLGRDYDLLRIYDLSGPQLLEMAYKENLDSTAMRIKVEKLAKADFIFCGGVVQRSYFLPFLLLAGHDIHELSLPVIHLALPTVPPARNESGRFELIAGGGFYPWQDPSPGLFAAASFVSQQPAGKARLRVVGTSHGISSSDESGFQSLRGQLVNRANVECLDFMAREDWIELQSSSSLAIDLHARNRERELAVTSRTIDHLWCGLPVLYNDYSELSRLIADYDAGWTVDPAMPQGARKALVEAAANPQLLRAKGENARRLARERFTYPQVWAPLAEFLDHPHKAPKRHAAAMLPMEECHRLLASDAQWQEVQLSRAYRVAEQISSLRGGWRKRARPAP